MGKFSSRQKRRMGIRSVSRMNRFRFTSAQKKNRPKTFKTEDAAHKYAKTIGLSQDKYSLRKVKHQKKFQVEPGIKKINKNQ